MNLTEKTTEPRSLTHVQFVKAYEALKEERDWFLTECPSAAKAAEKLSQMCGFRIGPHTIDGLREATGITWTVCRSACQLKGRTGGKRLTAHQGKTIVVAIAELYRRLGDTMSDDMVQLHKKLTQSANSNGESQ